MIADNRTVRADMSKKRIRWIDVAKGLAMFLVVLGHNPLTANGVKLVYCLNVPIFFLMSGYTFRTEKYESLWQLVKKLAKRILIPYVIMNLLAFGVYYWTRDLTPDFAGVKQLFWGMLYGVGDNRSLRFNIPLWFLPCIFVVQCMWYVIDRYGKKTKPFWIILSSIIGYFIFGIVQERLPWGADVAFTGVVFFALGNLFFKERVEKALFRIPSGVGFVIMLACNIGFNWLNKAAAPNVDVNSMVFGNYVMFYICAVSGCLAIIYLARMIEWSKALSYVGKNTMWVLGLHSLFIQLFELKIKLVIVSDIMVNSLILCILEIICVAVLKLLFDVAKQWMFVRNKKETYNQNEMR